MRVVVVGGGILGSTHAWQAAERGHEVVHLERERAARGASVRNFGLVWISGRSIVELPAALRSRVLWDELAARAPDVGLRPAGSLTLLRTSAEVAVAEAALARPDATDRGWTLLDAAEAQERNPALRGEFQAALWCPFDAVVEPRSAAAAIVGVLAGSDRYTLHAETEAVDVGGCAGAVHVRDDRGRIHSGDVVILCPGSALGGLTRMLAGPLPVRRVRLQMLQTQPLGEPLTTAVADGDSLRYYPAYRGPELDALHADQPRPAVAVEHHTQLLCVQRAGGGLTIGDTHSYDEPFDVDVHEAPYRHLLDTAAALLGRALPPVERRWSGVYAQCTEPEVLVHRSRPVDGVWLVTGPGGRGMTLAPVLAEQTADLIGL